MKLDRVAYLNPFIIDINNKNYTIGRIVVFDDGEILADRDRGWFGSNNDFYDGLELPCDCVKKNKVDLKCKTAFIVRGECDYDIRYDLYIPNSVIRLGKPVYMKAFGPYVKKTVRSELVDGVLFEDMKNCCPKYQEVMKNIQSVGEGISRFYVSSPVSEITDSIEKLEILKDELNIIKETIDNADAKTLYERG